MFVGFGKYCSVLNFIYSGQQHFYYNENSLNSRVSDVWVANDLVHFSLFSPSGASNIQI